MLIAELIHSCSHERIAQAALMSMGGDFLDRVALAAKKEDLSTGEFAAARVSEFGHDLDAVRRRAVADAMAGQDMPVLSGLRHILEPHIGPAATHRAGSAMNRPLWTCTKASSRPTSVDARK